jgi:hypothetical protein
MYTTIKNGLLKYAVYIIPTTAIFLSFFAAPVYATTAAEFNANRIIEDSVFTNMNSMSVADIQNFLNSKVPVCDTNGTQSSEFGGGTRAQWGAAHGHPAPFICLKNYSVGGRSAAQIIYDTARVYTINPQVFLVLLQKEQGLVTDTWPLDTQYRTATGYGCPDTAPCDSQYYGLVNQLDWSGKMFRAILNGSPNWFTPYLLGNNSIKWNPSASCGTSMVNIENRSTQALYNYTPYRPNQAALLAGYGNGDSCSAYGNRNFYLYFRDWFGYHSGPAAFKSANSSTIYVPVDGYKLTVPYMAALQDYGISAAAIETVSQAYVDSIPTPPVSTGFSNGISHVIKSQSDSDEDGASVYLISRGRRYQIQTMQQFYDMGFVDADISYIPLSYISSLASGGFVSYFLTSPNGGVFKLANSTKQEIFEYGTYVSQNPSDNITPLSYYLTDKIPSGNPITDRPVLIKMSNDAVSLYQNNKYYSIPSFDAFTCWGFNGPANVPVYATPQDNYIGSFTPESALSCLTTDGTTTQLMNVDARYTVPDSYGVTGALLLNTDLTTLRNRLPLRASALKQYVKANNSAAVWYLASGKRQLIPTYTAFLYLGLDGNSLDVVSPSVLASLTDDGIKLGDGELVKDSASSAIYTIANNQRVLYPSSNLFLAYRNDWNKIETFNTAQLDQNYPSTGGVVSSVLVDSSASKAYIIAKNGCFVLSSSSYMATGLTYSSLAAAQSYNTAPFRNISLSACGSATAFLKLSGQSLVYWVDNGQKHAITTYSGMLSRNNGTPPTVMEVGQDLLDQIPTGTSF